MRTMEKYRDTMLPDYGNDESRSAAGSQNLNLSRISDPVSPLDTTANNDILDQLAL